MNTATQYFLSNIDENAIVRAVSARLMSLGCEIISQLTSADRGIDVIARNYDPPEMYYVEAKGGTSTVPTSRRYGKPYTKSQIFDRAAKGVFTCVTLRAKFPILGREKVILAVPNLPHFHTYLDPLTKQLQSIGIEVWFL